MEIVGQIIAGKQGNILIRQKDKATLELGDLLVAEQDDGAKLILQVFDLQYGTQIPSKSLELMSGMDIEGYGGDLVFIEEKLRNYILASVKVIASVTQKDILVPKVLPKFLGSIRRAEKDDFSLLGVPHNSIFLGNIRSGSKILDVPLYLDGRDVFSHHVLVPATTGRGKSNLMKVMLWDALDKDYCGIMVLDAHDEYYGRNNMGLKDHSKARDNLLYYTTTKPPRGAVSLILNIKNLRPWHFMGVVELTPAQREALYVYYNEFKEGWISEIVRGTDLFESKGVRSETLAVLKRRFDVVLGLESENERIISRSNLFVESGGESTVKDIVNALEGSKKVIIDTSVFSDEVELLIGSIVAHAILERHKKAKSDGTLEEKPTISVLLEEAPRVLSEEVLKAGNNIYSTIAREGRKFKVGLIAITQLSSIIPRNILANMNTKIILGNEMASERRAIIESAAQDLSTDDRTIASLDKGEALVSSNFTKFAIPIKIPLFEEYAKNKKGREAVTGFIG